MTQNLDTDETLQITELLTELGRRHLHYLVNEVAVELLKAKAPFSESQRAAVLRALSSVASESPEMQSQVKAFDYVLGPLLAPYIEDTDSPLLLRAAVRCFPFIRHPSPDRFAATAFRVGTFSLHEDRYEI